MKTCLLLLVAACLAASEAQQARRVAKRGAGGNSWDQLALLASFHPYAALLGGAGNLLHADALGLASAPNLDLYGLHGGGNYGLHGGGIHGGGIHGGGQYGGLGLLNVAAAAPVGYNPYFNPYRQLLPQRTAPNHHANVLPPSHAAPSSNVQDQVDKAINAYMNRGENLSYLAAYRPSTGVKGGLATPGGGLETDKAVNTYAQTAILSTVAPPPAREQTNYADKPFQPSAAYQPSKPFQPSPTYEPTRLSLYAHAPNPLHQHEQMTAAVSTTPTPLHPAEHALKLSASYSAAAPSAVPSVAPSAAPSVASRFNAASHPLFGVYGTAFPPHAALRPQQHYY